MKATDFARRYQKFVMSEKRIYQKFWNGLKRIAEEEYIELFYFNSVYDLNKTVYPDSIHNMVRSEYAAGIYKWQQLPGFGFLPHKSKIYLSRGENQSWYDCSNTMVFAHELGHHFSIKDKMDRSEKAANNYIRTLAKKILTDFELNIIEHTLLIYSDNKTLKYDKYYSKEELMDNEIYYDLNKSVKEFLKNKQKLQDVAEKYYKNKYPLIIEHKKIIDRLLTWFGISSKK